MCLRAPARAGAQISIGSITTPGNLPSGPGALKTGTNFHDYQHFGVFEFGE